MRPLSHFRSLSPVNVLGLRTAPHTMRLEQGEAGSVLNRQSGRGVAGLLRLALTAWRVLAIPRERTVDLDYAQGTCPVEDLDGIAGRHADVVCDDHGMCSGNGLKLVDISTSGTEGVPAIDEHQVTCMSLRPCSPRKWW